MFTCICLHCLFNECLHACLYVCLHVCLHRSVHIKVQIKTLEGAKRPRCQ